jgi:nicotinic acid mononucleotide adenylyltransferase
MLIAAGASDAKLLELLPPAVLDYIRRHRLYQA